MKKLRQAIPACFFMFWDVGNGTDQIVERALYKILSILLH
jgi:hypothetical protein